jgi:hypothetical protein
MVFASKLQYTEQVEQLGFTEALAKDFSIGFYRGQVYIPIRHTDGSISGFVGYADGQLKLPPKWLPATSNVVTFPKKTALAVAPLSRGAFLFYRPTPDIRIMGAGVGIGAKAGLLGRGAAGPVLLHVG